MKDPLPQKDNPYEGPVAPKRQPLIQDMPDMKTVLKCWLRSRNGRCLCPKPPLYLTNPYMTTSLQISINSQRIRRKDKNGVPLCPGMAVI